MPRTTDGSSPTSGGNADDINGGSAGKVVYQTAPNTTDFTNATAGILTSNGTTPTFTPNASVTVGSATTATTATSSTTATNIAGGTSGKVPYQSGAGATSFTTNTTGVLTSDGTTPDFVTTLPVANGGTGQTALASVLGVGSALTAGSATTATTATNIAGGSAGFVVQTAPGTTGFLTNASSGVVIFNAGIPSVQSTLVVSRGGTGQGGAGYGTAGYLKTPGGTGVFTSSATVPVADISGVLPIANGGTGQSSLASVLGVGSALTAGSATTATTATNIAGGSTAVVPYQSASGTTTFTSTASSGVLQTDGTTPAFTNQIALTNSTNVAALTATNTIAAGTGAVEMLKLAVTNATNYPQIRFATSVSPANDATITNGATGLTTRLIFNVATNGYDFQQGGVSRFNISNVGGIFFPSNLNIPFLRLNSVGQLIGISGTAAAGAIPHATSLTTSSYSAAPTASTAGVFICNTSAVPSWTNGPLPIANGGTGETAASTFAPVFSKVGGAGTLTSVSYSAQLMTYSKIGSLYTAYMRVVFVPTITGGTITGKLSLPVTPEYFCAQFINASSIPVTYYGGVCYNNTEMIITDITTPDPAFYPLFASGVQYEIAGSFTFKV